MVPCWVQDDRVRLAALLDGLGAGLTETEMTNAVRADVRKRREAMAVRISTLGRKEWEKLHGKPPGPPHAKFAFLGWEWQPIKCRHTPACILDTGGRTRRGLS